MNRKFSFGTPPKDIDGKVEWIIRALRNIENASNETDVFNIADAFTLSNVTSTRTLDADTTASPIETVVQMLADVLGTFISDLKKRGSKRAV
jgi:methylphosphotriester-DNA--protein-cysteine methyltransferase